MKPADPLHQRWLRLEVHVRCALYPDQVGRLRAYLGTGELLVRRGLRPAAATQARMLHTLLRCARDEGLPWFWRSLCLEHADLPLARLRSQLALHDPLSVAALEDELERARAALPLGPGPADPGPIRRPDLKARAADAGAAPRSASS
ncbi:hypothetical protein G8A07_05260 [Roseateles sp. DAIF2]|uniref:hypothetical protein n=1 Tax=Roseateles sp. DAIF2 TaxID=2714952 RepID=UPI0018A3142B|nr:hypothetical protein [Roseateles sp. DAIF2]QPF72400.1 hypothetical protein G8A07_05260 [Roseateles sp. DAIF2]